jgi:hypothetical protein
VQVNVALVVTREGIPLGHETFLGNTADVKTLREIVASMEQRYGRARRVWVMDRGMVSQANLDWLRQDLLDHRPLLDRGQQAQAATAVGASENVGWRTKRMEDRRRKTGNRSSGGLRHAVPGRGAIDAGGVL